MAIKPYTLNGKKLFEVYVHGAYMNGRRFQRRKRQIESIRKAEEVEFEFERELAKLKEEGVPIRWHEWQPKALSRMRMDFSESTARMYEMYLRKWVYPFWMNRDVKSITREDVYHAVHERFEAKFTPSSRKTLLKIVKRLLQMALEEGHIDRNPAVGVKVNVPEVEQKVLTNEEAKIFLTQAKLVNHRYYPIWIMALMTGMRSAELQALIWTDVDFEARTIMVSKQWNPINGNMPTKTKRSRIVPISDELLPFLKELKLKSKGEWVLPKIPDWNPSMQSSITREFCLAIGVTSVKFHDLRATFITNLLSRGESLARVMSIVGHSQLKTTNGYLRKAGVEVKGGTDKLGYGIPSDVTGDVIQLVK